MQHIAISETNSESITIRL